MTREDFLRLFEESLRVAPGSIEETRKLKSLKEWDSMGVIAFMVAVDERLGSSISPQAIENCETVADLLTVLVEMATGYSNGSSAIQPQ